MYTQIHAHTCTQAFNICPGSFVITYTYVFIINTYLLTLS